MAREQRDSGREPAGKAGETGVLTEPPLPQRKSASTPRPQRDGSPREAERKPEPAVFSPSPVVGQEQPPPMRTLVPETEESESDASDEPGPKEDPPHLMARPASDLEGDREAAELDQEEAGGAEPSAQLELGYERDPEGHPSETWSASGPGTRQREPPGRWNVPRDGGLRNGGVSVRHLQWNHPLPR